MPSACYAIMDADDFGYFFALYAFFEKAYRKIPIVLLDFT
ncbi:hypothetical protein SAMN02745220_04032 [Desulfopila aestuarii DSM 18488]|uniref:Uncharacterized protein n=1 Tax=Desulfopila aestuarii DSM 18488 TaxID=1121416 RepID=A0A1M7YG41_9BACT|nr:hypothetical protein SAMN02745220_04032 [Desulfopila aestuarii DSM 18488]